MTPQHAQSSGGGSAGRAIVLVIVAIALGVFLLARGFGGGDNSDDATSSDNGTGETTSGGGASDGDSSDTEGTASPTTSSTTTTTTAPPVVTHLPGEVKVAVMNGTGGRGRAGRTADTLNAAGYVTAAKNTQQDRVDRSVIYYKDGYGDDAKAVASVLGAPADIITPAPGTIMTLIRNPETPENLEDFNVYAVVGTDNVILDPAPPSG